MSKLSLLLMALLLCACERLDVEVERIASGLDRQLSTIEVQKKQSARVCSWQSQKACQTELELLAKSLGQLTQSIDVYLKNPHFDQAVKSPLLQSVLKKVELLFYSRPFFRLKISSQASAPIITLKTSIQNTLKKLHRQLKAGALRSYFLSKKSIVFQIEWPKRTSSLGAYSTTLQNEEESLALDPNDLAQFLVEPQNLKQYNESSYDLLVAIGANVYPARWLFGNLPSDSQEAQRILNIKLQAAENLGGLEKILALALEVSPDAPIRVGQGQVPEQQQLHRNRFSHDYSEVLGAEAGTNILFALEADYFAELGAEYHLNSVDSSGRTSNYAGSGAIDTALAVAILNQQIKLYSLENLLRPIFSEEAIVEKLFTTLGESSLGFEEQSEAANNQISSHDTEAAAYEYLQKVPLHQHLNFLAIRAEESLRIKTGERVDLTSTLREMSIPDAAYYLKEIIWSKD